MVESEYWKEDRGRGVGGVYLVGREVVLFVYLMYIVILEELLYVR